MAPRVTMRGDAVPRSHHPRSAPEVVDPTLAQIAAERWVLAAPEAVGGGLRDTLSRIVCAGEDMKATERALAGRRGRAAWC